MHGSLHQGPVLSYPVLSDKALCHVNIDEMFKILYSLLNLLSRRF